MKIGKHPRTKDRLPGGIPVRIILPVSLTVILFGLTIFLLLLPLIEEKLLDGKREMIRELTESSWSILAAHAQEERDGLLTRDKAQASAIDRDLPALRADDVHADPRVPGLEDIFTRIQERTGCFLVGGMTASRGVQEQIADEVTEGGVSGILFGSEIKAILAEGSVSAIRRGAPNGLAEGSWLRSRC